MLILEEIVKVGKVSLFKGDIYSLLDLWEWDD